MVYPRSLFSPPIVRLGVTPDEPAEGPPAIVEQRPHRLGRLVSDVVLAKVRHLYEGTDLTHRQIAARTGVHHVSVSRWGRHFGWQRPPHAPRASNMVPDWRAGPQLKLSKLAIRLKALAERHVRELEEAPHIDVELLMQALQVLKMARLEAMGHRGRGRRRTGPAVTGAWATERDNAIRTALKEMQRGGVNLDRAPKEAVEMLIEANTPREEHPALRERGRYSRRNREHARMLEKE